MGKQLLGTFQTRDVADSVKDAFIDDGFDTHDLIVLANLESADPPAAADLELGTAGEGGFIEFEEKIGKAVRRMFGKKDRLHGDLSEGAPSMGALLAVKVADDLAEARARKLFAFYRAADVEVAEED